MVLACGGTYYTQTGMIHSPNWPGNYGHDKECTWIIKVQPGRQVKLNFTIFDMENHTDCRFDFLELR